MNLDKIKEYYGVNEEQAEALNIDENIALHAGAGSGKTRVLTRRFLRLLLEKELDIEDIVAITFTKKAALEMKERIIDLVNEFIKIEKNSQKKEKLKKIKEKIPFANISTFHSFCDSIIKENYYLIGIDPNYQIIEEVDTLTLVNRFCKEILNKFISDNNYRQHFEALFEIIEVEFILNDEILKELKKLFLDIRTKGNTIDEVKNTSNKNIINYFKNNNNNYNNDQLVVDLMIDMISELDKMYTEEKKQLNILDFNDLEKYTLEILKNNKEVKEKYNKCFLVDEFQDTNDIQFEILMNLVENNGEIEKGKLFVVGDIKQSIYLFRGANYNVFNKVTEKIQKNGQKLNLSTNYRSYDYIVDTINNMFRKVIGSYEDSKKSNKKDDKVGFIKIFIEEEKDKEEFKVSELKKRAVDKKELQTLINKIKENRREKEAEEIANKIVDLNKKGIEYKDIAILFRNRNNLLEFEKALKNKNIPYTVIGGVGFYDRQEIRDLINLLRFIYSENDKLSFLGVIRSPFIGLKDNEIEKIFSNNRDGKINSIKGNNEKIDKLFELKSKALFFNVYDFLVYADKELNIKEIFLGTNDGIQKYRNFEKFLEIAKEFENKGIYSSIEFLEYIENLVQVSEKESQATLDSESSDAVKIMTIHMSKGLEFEAVFVPCLDYIIERDGNMFIYDKELGIVFNNEKIKEMYDKVYNSRIVEERKEEVRILYVAATRAIRFLSFSGLDKYRERDKTILSEIDKLELDKFIKDIDKFENKISKIKDKKENKIYLNESEYIPKSLISVSKYMIYKECPKKYFFRYIAKIDGETLKENILEGEYVNAIKVGSFIHKVIEDIVNGKNFDLKERIKIELGEINEEQEQRINKLINNFYNLEKEKKDIKDIKTEFEFKIKLPESNIELIGFIDRVDILNGNKIDIIDYKTNLTGDIEKLKIAYKPQFIVYNYAIRNIYQNKNINKMYLCLLENGEKIEINFTEEELNETLKDIVNVFKDIEAKNSFDLYTKENCNEKCWYRDLCIV